MAGSGVGEPTGKGDEDGKGKGDHHRTVVLYLQQCVCL